ncbi:MAG: RNA polymerase factor sigma-54 [Clostridia bacterium]|nr:RNA polymerase factor sigma-54 [Clostridia bacterium]
MRLGFGLSLEQTQKLIMTPELRQAITILQLSAMELAEYIEQELLENPVLEKKEEAEKGEQEEATADENREREDKFDIDWQEYFQDRSDLGYTQRERGGEPEQFGFENFLSQAPSLQETLLTQLSLTNLSKAERKIGEYIIGNIDEHGYLTCTLEESTTGLDIQPEQAEKVLNVIQTFDPPGVGARNLVECLLLQVDSLNIENKFLRTLIKHYLPDLAEGRVQKIAKDLDATVQDIQEAADILKTLDPKPGRKFGSPHDVRYVIPDVVVERVEGQYIVLVNDTSAPRLGINSTYRSVLSGAQADEEAKKFVESKLNSASWLIKSIEQRRLTLYKVANCLVELQKDFLEHGIRYLKPLNLKQVAEIVGMHESTISRATSNKYIQTPKGVFEMKYFFSSGVDDVTGTMISSQSIKRMIRDLVEAEDPKKPLSDQRIGDILVSKGLNISRRTVAKYRDEIGIQAAGKRRRY